jgi:anhydro-N-acetylmuramic acid kinase
LDSAQALATITALTARSIAAAYSDLINDSTDKEKSEILILGGGGAANKTLVSMLEEAWPHPVEIVDHEFFGISTKFKESLLFALLAYTTYFQVPNNVPVCTGASKRVCLGKIARS